MPLKTSAIARRVIGHAIDVHRALGPGLLESAYERCLLHEFLAADLDIEHQVPVPVTYRGQVLDCSYRADFIVERSLVVEVKAVDALLPVHTAQVLTYLRLTKIREGLLMNFNTVLLKHGIRSLLLDAPSPDGPAC